MRKPKITKFQFATEPKDNFYEAVGLPEEKVTEVFKDAQAAKESTNSFSELAKNLNDNFSKAETILIIISLSQKLMKMQSMGGLGMLAAMLGGKSEESEG